MSAFHKKLYSCQKKIINELSVIFKDNFIKDPWSSSLGSGLTAVCQGTNIEKSGVNVSVISGTNLPPAALKKHKELSGCAYTAAGLSVIIHPGNPHVPTAHLNIRLFECPEKGYWWFGGGYDLTPYIGYEDDVRLWHDRTKSYLDRYDESLYQDWKTRCDDYFYLKHRKEPRGVGGVFFDELQYQNCKHTTEELVIGLADQFIGIYSQIAQKRLSHKYSSLEKEFQLIRRGRYVEFNLLQDRGTLFGLQSGGRVESILISLPNAVSWSYGESGKYSNYINRLYRCWNYALKRESNKYEER